MKKLLQTLRMTMILIVISNLYAVAQQPPDKFVGGKIGFVHNAPNVTLWDRTQTSANPLGYMGAGGTFITPSITPQNFALAFQMPPIMESNNSSVLLVYTRAEIGTNGIPAKLLQISIPIENETPNSNVPFDLYQEWLKGWARAKPTNPGNGTQTTLDRQRVDLTDFADRLSATKPVNIKIQMRNMPTSQANQFINDNNIQRTILNDAEFKEVWNGQWNYTSNALRLKTINETQYLFLEIELDTPFDYEGGDVWIAITNTSTNSSIWNNIYNPTSPIPAPGVGYADAAWDAGPYTYGFKCFRVLAAASDGRFLGPKISSENLVINWDITEGHSNHPFGTYPYCRYASAYYTAGAGEAPYQYGSPYVATPNGQTIIGVSPAPSTDEYKTYNRNFIIDQQTVSLRPMMLLSYAMMTTDGSTVAASSLSTGNESVYVMAEFTLKTKNTLYPLKLKRVNFSTEGTTSGTAISKAILYKTATGTLQDTIRIAEVGITSGTTAYSLIINDNTLNEGDNNKYLIIYEIPSGNNCSSMLGIKINSYEVGDRVDPDSVTEDTATYTISVNQDQALQKSLDLQSMSVGIKDNDEQTINVCFDDNARTFTLSVDLENVQGSYSGFQWRRSTDNGATWELITGQTRNSITITKDLRYNKYKCTVIPATACGSLPNNELVFAMNYHFSLTDAKITYTGNMSLGNIFRAGDLLPFSSEVTGGGENAQYLYSWETREGYSDLWIALPDANNTTCRYYVSYDRHSRQVDIRLRVINAGYCGDTLYSNVLSFDIDLTDLTQFYFVEESGPTPNKLTICEYDYMELVVSYFGSIDPAKSRWQREGVDVLDENGRPISDRILRIPATFSAAGTYQYVAAAIISDSSSNEARKFDTLELKSKPCEVFVTPQLKILEQPQQELFYAITGEPIVFRVTSTYTENKESDVEQGFQWYIHRTATGEEKLSDDYVLKGTQSNVLVMIDPPNPDDDRYYTYNNDYYFLRITGPCGYVEGNRILILPAEGMRFVAHPSDVYVCDVGETASFSVIVEASLPVKYKWYYDGVELTDNNRISGSDTRTLTINPIAANDLTAKYYCIVSLESNPNTFIRSREVGILNKTITLTNKMPATDDVSISTNENQTFGLSWTANHSDSYGGTVVYFVNGVEKHRLHLTDVSDGTIRIEVKTDDLLVSDTLFTLTLTDECNNIISANWRISVTENNEFNGNNSSIEDGDDLLLNSVVIMPNPVTDEIEISFVAENAQLKIQLCDLTGTAVATLFDGDLQAGANKLKFSLQNLNIPSGTYFIKVLNKNINVSKQFLFIR